MELLGERHKINQLYLKMKIKESKVSLEFRDLVFVVDVRVVSHRLSFLWSTSRIAGVNRHCRCIRTDGRTDGRTNGRTDGRTVGRTEGRTEGRTDGRTDGRTEGRTDRQSDDFDEG